MSTLTEPTPANGTARPPRPTWLRNWLAKWRGSVNMVSILHGAGVYDTVETGRSTIDWMGNLLLNPPIAMELVATYTLHDEGGSWRFVQETMRERFLELAELQGPPLSEDEKLMGEKPKPAMIPTDPRNAIRTAIKVLKAAPEAKAIIFIEGVDLCAAKADKGILNADRSAVLGMLRSVGRDRALIRRGNPLILVAEKLAELHEDLLAASTGIGQFNVPLPDREARALFLNQEVYKRPNLKLEMSIEDLASLTAGMQRRHLEDLILLANIEAQRLGQPAAVITFELVRNYKKETIAGEFGGVLEFKEPKGGFELYAGAEYLKQQMRDEVLDGLVRGDPDTPMALVLTGEPGTGKTFLAECAAGEAGVNFIVYHQDKVLGKYVGESEGKQAKAFEGIDANPPCIVVFDEADQTQQRQEGGGGNNVAGNQFARTLEWLGQPEHRGKLVALFLSNRGDQIDPALVSRADVRAPVLAPETEAERAEVLVTQMRRYGVELTTEDTLEPARLMPDWVQRDMDHACAKAARLLKRGLPVRTALLNAARTRKPLLRDDAKLMKLLAISTCNDTDWLPPKYRAQQVSEAERTKLAEEIATVREREVRSAVDL